MKEYKIKLFVAVPIPPELKKELNNFFSINNSVTNIRWTPERNYHVTLFFIGFINSSKLPSIKEKLNSFITAQNCFALSFDKFSLEGKPTKKSMIWMRFKHSPEFENLASQIGFILKNELEEVQNFKRSIPHVTLARLRKSVKRNEIKLDMVHDNQILQVSELQLWQSVSSPKGMVYNSIDNFYLKK